MRTFSPWPRKAPHWILAVSKDDLNPAAKTAVWQLPKGLREPDALVSFNSVAPGGPGRRWWTPCRAASPPGPLPTPVPF